MRKLDGMVALVTGAARMRGIGRAIALRLADEGADIVVSGLPRDAATFPEHEKAVDWRGSASVAAEIEAKGRRVVALDCDVTDTSQVQGMIAKTVQALGSLGAVVNNAGIPSGAGGSPIVEMDDALWYRTIDVNINGVYLVSKFAARHMLEADKGGAIVNISSTAGRVGMANYGAYCATKFGVIGFTQQLAQELARKNIRVNCICPGSTDTDMMDGTFERIAARGGSEFTRIKSSVGRVIPMGRQGLVDEQAAVVAFLVGPDASYVTGQTINVDGGSRMD